MHVRIVFLRNIYSYNILQMCRQTEIIIVMFPVTTLFTPHLLPVYYFIARLVNNKNTKYPYDFLRQDFLIIMCAALKSRVPRRSE